MSPKSPPVVRNIFKFILMAFGLGIIGTIFGIASVFIIYKIIVGDSPGLGAPIIGMIGLVIGYLIGVIVGIVLIKRIFHQRGSLLFGIVGSIFGGVLVRLVASPLDLYNSIFGYPVFFLSASVFFLVGFYLGGKIRKSRDLEEG